MNVTAAAQQVSQEKMVAAGQTREVLMLKKTLDNQEMLQQQLVKMLQEIQPHIGANINLQA